MKKKIGEIYNKPIVVGNKNEITKNEIHLGELQGGGARNIKYYDLSGQDNDTKGEMSVYGILVKLNIAGSRVIYGQGQFINEAMQGSLLETAESAEAVAIDFDAIFEKAADGETKMSDLLPPEVIAGLGLTEITEEEFYNFDE